jgi:hypothetical protein
MGEPITISFQVPPGLGPQTGYMSFLQAPAAHAQPRAGAGTINTAAKTEFFTAPLHVGKSVMVIGPRAPPGRHNASSTYFDLHTGPFFVEHLQIRLGTKNNIYYRIAAWIASQCAAPLLMASRFRSGSTRQVRKKSSFQPFVSERS